MGLKAFVTNQANKLFFILPLLAAVAMMMVTTASARELTVVALGDSLTAGYGLDPSQSFPVRLEAALRERGHAVTIVNAGVSGDTSAGGLERLDWSVPDGTDAVIVELGANDALRGLSTETTRQNLTAIVERLQQRGIPVLLAGMLAPPNMGADYADAFNAIFPDLASKYDLAFYPFFLDGVAANLELVQADGMHPTADGIDEIVDRFVPDAEKWLVGLSTNEGN